MIIRKLRLLIVQGRPQLLPVSMSVPLAGALTHGITPNGVTIITLLLIGACAHLAGFIFNDLMDFRLDRMVSTRQNSPLIRGEITPKTAFVFALLQFPLAIVAYRIVLQGTSIGLLTLLASIICSLIYNRWSKWGRLPRILPEVALALSIALLCMAGVFVASEEIQSAQVLFCGMVGLVLLFVNSIPSGIKDIATDAQFGATSFVLSTGSHVTDDGTLRLSWRLRLYTLVVQSIITGGTITLMLVYRAEGWILVIIPMLLMYAWLHVRQMLITTTLSQFKRNIPFLGGFYNYFAVFLIVWATLPALLKIPYLLLLLLVLSFPLIRAYTLWQKRYVPILEK